MEDEDDKDEYDWTETEEEAACDHCSCVPDYPCCYCGFQPIKIEEKDGL